MSLKMNKYIFLVLFLCSLFLFTCSSSQPLATTTPIRVMSLGDSICRRNMSFLRPVVAKSGLNIDWVGTKKNGPSPDPENECHGGWKAAEVIGAMPPPSWVSPDTPILSHWVSSTKPNIVLMMLGTNDFFNSGDPKKVPEHLENIIDTIHKNNSNTHIAVASITPFGWSSGNKKVSSLNVQISGLVKKKQAQGKKVHFVDMFSAVPLSGLSSDGVHLNDKGNRAMAKTWFTALKKIIKDNGKFTRTTIPTKIASPSSKQNSSQVTLATPNQTPTQKKFPTTRDKFLWPFASTSLWNLPIGSGARYIPANIDKAGYAGADEEYFYKLKSSDPLRPVYAPGSWTKRCADKKTKSMGISLPIPDDLIIPDARTKPRSTPNNVSAFLMPNDKTLVQIAPLARCQSGGAIYGWRYFPDSDIYGDGIGGAHFGSGLSSIGGSIRKGELTNNEPIRHALKILIFSEKYLYYSQSLPGYRWPANRADNYAAQRYHGKNAALLQGSLLAIPPKVTASSLKLQTPAGKKLFHALQDYGAYIVDDASWDAHYFAVEKGVLEEFDATYGYKFSGRSGKFYDDFMSLFQAMHIVDNNTAKTIGGGGNRRAPLAPPIGN